jgi:hypothetical protein
MLLQDPVCNEYGYSYSKKAYLNYLKNSSKDPVTGKEITKINMLFPNFNLKKAVELCLEEYPWAYEKVISN